MAAGGALEQLRLIHIAAHTKLDGAHLLESQLVLAPTSSGEDASYLSAREIATQWRLNADLVCLTGCRSASGMSSAAQGWLGFQYAFLRAGARSVLVSLWPVDDAAAALLVKAFYADLARSERGGRLGSRSEALMHARQVVREWRDSSGLQPFAHPAYWSGFALIGEPGRSADPVPGGRPHAAVHRSAAQR
jgi:CHAT domain-containing protein